MVANAVLVRSDFRSVVAFMVWLILGSSLLAKPPHKTAVVNHFSERLPVKLRSCELCHLSDQEIQDAPVGTLSDVKKPWNSFGKSLARLGARQVEDGALQPQGILDRLQHLADDDADGDGVANELELLAGTWPGNAEDRPTEQQLAAAMETLEALRSTSAYAWKPFEPVKRPHIPQIENIDNIKWIANPIDAFIAMRHRDEGIVPQPPASKATLLRRVYLDLVGLPPTREALTAFLADDSPDAYAKVVDQLLASPGYGERWGRHWMDVWRYSDWAGWGEQVRDSHKHIWRWRDWIIESLNQDMPYNQMVLEMLAADELDSVDEESLRATGFLVRNYKRLSREQWMSETVDHTSRALLGVTFKCAQCHDHMYDPLLHEEYFQFRAIFEPYKVRIDPTDGVLDTEKVGLSRVYDGDPDAKTLFYLRGDERTPDPDRQIVPGVPAYLGGGPLDLTPVQHSQQQYYPSLRPEMIAAFRKQVQDKVDTARDELAQVDAERTRMERELTLARTQVSVDDSQGDDGKRHLLDLESEFQKTEAEFVLARSRHEGATADQVSLEARIAAENAKHGLGDASRDDLQPLAHEASRRERQANHAAAELQRLEAQRELEALERSSGEEGEDRRKVREARKKVEERQKKRDEAVEAVSADSREYSTLGQVYPSTSSGRRLALARWITDRQNPLTARVAVNHIWTRHFGQGLVPSVDEFGGNGKPSTFPALHDWLAVELMEPSFQTPSMPTPEPWSMKHLHRLIVLSSTYQMGSRHDSAAAELDPANRFLWRMMPRRLEAEAVRDSILHVAGSLDPRMGGEELDHRQVLLVPRRSLYFRHAPEKQAEFLRIFDVAAPTECYQRRDSVIPQQALALANSELTIKQSRRLARDLQQQARNSEVEFVELAFQQVLTRRPTSLECSECVGFLAERRSALESGLDGGERTEDPSDLTRPAADAQLRARENLVHVLLNHHEFVVLP